MYIRLTFWFYFWGLFNLMSLNHFLCSNEENSPSQALEVSGSDSLKSDKYYLSSALADGVLQQVEVTVNSNFYI